MEPFKNLFNQKSAELIADAIKRNHSSFDKKAFLKNIDKELSPLELKERVHFLAEKLYAFLPKDVETSIPLLIGALKQDAHDVKGVSGMTVWPLTHYISLYGLDHFDLSLNALKEMTKQFTSEFAIRPFFIKDQKRVLNQFSEWIDDESEHVRRWVSEGSRPLLPWGMKLNDVARDPDLTWMFLEKLKNDPSAYVRKSVANHINDHSKNHPDYVIEKLLGWHKSKNKTVEMSWIIKHASRTLIKKGHKRAFLLHGVKTSKIKVVEQKILTKKITLGESLKVSVTLVNETSTKTQVIIDHEIHFLKANGKHSVKVFKGKKIVLNSGERQKLELSIPLKAVTTRVYYAGKQCWNVLVNGVSEKDIPFKLIISRQK